MANEWSVQVVDWLLIKSTFNFPMSEERKRRGVMQPNCDSSNLCLSPGHGTTYLALIEGGKITVWAECGGLTGWIFGADRKTAFLYYITGTHSRDGLAELRRLASAVDELAHERRLSLETQPPPIWQTEFERAKVAMEEGRARAIEEHKEAAESYARQLIAGSVG